VSRHCVLLLLLTLCPALEARAQGARTGTIDGHVRLDAAPPANPVIRMGADPLCAKLNRARGVEPRHQIVVRAADGGLAGTFVSLQGAFPAVPVPAEPVTIDQQGCVFTPRVIGARAGQTLQVKNSDMTAHNVHGITTKGNTFNVSQPVAGIVSRVRLKNAETMLRVRCDIHSWMIGYIGVVAHPYFAVSDGGGAFRIANVPPGKYTLRTWHERYGELTRTVEVSAGKTTTVEFGYAGTEKPNAARLRDWVLPESTVAYAVSPQ
jgi:plastocyanin